MVRIKKKEEWLHTLHSVASLLGAHTSRVPNLKVCNVALTLRSRYDFLSAQERFPLAARQMVLMVVSIETWSTFRIQMYFRNILLGF